MDKHELARKVAEILGEEIPEGVKLDPEEVEFLVRYKHGLVQYMDIKQFSWVTGIHRGTVSRYIRRGVYPYELYFRKPHGSGRYRIHISCVSAIMAGPDFKGHMEVMRYLHRE